MKKKFESQKTIYLIDGSTFLYRAYYSMRQLTAPSGVPVQAVYVFCRMIKKLIKDFDPHMMVLLWDSKGGSKDRFEIFPEYKAGRQAAPSDLFTQKDLIINFAKIIGLPQIQMEGVEADDLINSIVQEQKEKNFDLVIIASDKDLYQLIEKNVFVFDPFKDDFTDSEKFEQKMGFGVQKLPFYFALLGDTSDNIPGVKGIGKTGATELVKQFESLEDLYSNIEKVSKDRIRKLLLENKENAFLSYDLFKARYYPTNLSEEDLKFSVDNWFNAKSFFEELNFKSLLQDFEKIPEKHEEEKPYFADEKGYQFKCVTTKEELDLLCKYLIEKGSFAIDTETTGLDPLQNECIGISICAQKGLAYYIPFGHKINVQLSLNSEKKEIQLSKEEIFKVLRSILENDKYKKYLHNAKFDQLVLYNSGINLKGIEFDTMIAADLALEDGNRIGLKALSSQLLQERMLSFDEIVKDKKIKNFSYVPLADATKYAAGDAHQTFALKEILQKKLIENNLEKLFYQMEMPLTEILFKMQIEGIFVDKNILSQIDKILTEEIKKSEQEIIDLTGVQDTINLNSPKQIEDLLFNKLKLTPLKKSAKGKSYSTDQSVLEELGQTHPVPNLIIKYRELFKLKTTYVDALPEYINSKTNRIHTTFSQTSTATGRLSSFDPNLQNIPTDGYEIRSAFKPEDGRIFLSADYSQIELRILAYFSQDKNLIDAFLKNEDIHTRTAAYLFDIPINQVTNQQRQIGKRINFSIIYGLTPFGLSKDLKIPFKDAKNYIEKYFAQYPGVLSWMESIVTFAKQNGYVETLFGRRRYVPGIYEKNRILFDLARRIAINTPAQGTAADIMKIGMINLSKAFEENKIDAKILLQIHDELLISVAENQKQEAEKLTKNILESVISWNIPLIVTTRFGKNWQEVTK